ncbi:hypothetical protein EV383_4887 [Pseudonocardia sediminis]|uniref:IrrE N-terminal-like domain-containing protein n=1 Tax=Pseudonocardia sediminis TaxID=1397368 RepID=A0A4Q7V5B8_PSEST|nr:hypothetical protein [Pseudonocardia sediminis]RZT87953.1 hypothetical protein EV383_4887 [Pseudonocardia sediminis]
MGERRLRWRCRRLLRDLDVRPPIDVTELCRRLGAHRGRELRLMPWELAVPGPFGVWFETDDVDVIAYQSRTSRAHQDHIVLHEVGHIVAGHGGDSTAEEDEQILPDVPGGAGSARRLRRTCYDAANEREAELIASILGEGMGLLSDGGASGVEPAGSRVDGSLTIRPGWWS